MKVMWRQMAAQGVEELERTGRLTLRAPALQRSMGAMARFLLGAVLAAGELWGGYAPLAVGLVGASGPGVPGLMAVLGSCLGYLLFRGLVEGVRYMAACVLAFSVAFAFYDVKLYRKSWFMPVVTAGMDAITGFVYLGDSRWAAEAVIAFCSEILLAGLAAYAYRTALAVLEGGRPERELSQGEKAALICLGESILVALAGAELLPGLSVGRLLGLVAVLVLASCGGPTLGCAAGMFTGAGLDLAAGSGGSYTMAFGLAGLLAGGSWRQGRLFTAVAGFLSSGAALFWCWGMGQAVPALSETALACVTFFLLPERLLQQVRSRLRREERPVSVRRAAEYVDRHLEQAARAFRSIRDSLRNAFPPPGPNDGDPAAIFDRTAERVCQSCALRNSCWGENYVGTFNALNDALPAMLERGRGEAADLPGWFSSRCLHFTAFLRTANEEVTAYRYRRQYVARLRESRGAVCRQYGTLADILTGAAMELSEELSPDPLRERRVRNHLTALGFEGEGAAYYDIQGRLRVEISGRGAEKLSTPEEVRRLSDLMGLPLRREEEQRPGRAVFLQVEPYQAIAGSAARRREGQQESGDTGTWFRRDDGSLFVLLCDGMGSGEAARRESALAVRLLEELLRAGMESPAALRTVNSALALRNEEAGAFTTVDLLRIDLFTGAGELCKLGAAASYLRRSGQVSRYVGSALPAGLTDGEDAGPDHTSLQLSPGDWVVLLSDGVVGNGEEDGWVRTLLKDFQGHQAQDLAQAILQESEARVGPGDDRMVVAVRLEQRGQ